MTFATEIRRSRGPTAARELAQRDAVKDCARSFITAFQAAMTGRRPSFVIEVARWVIRALTKIVEDQGDIGRAHGVLSGAAVELNSTWRSEADERRAAADAAFGGKAPVFAREEAA